MASAIRALKGFTEENRSTLSRRTSHPSPSSRRLHKAKRRPKVKCVCGGRCIPGPWRKACKHMTGLGNCVRCYHSESCHHG